MLVSGSDLRGTGASARTLRPVDRLARSLRYYDLHAAAYAASTMAIDTSPQLHRFTSLLRRGARVLDAGCGSGRDLTRLVDLGCDALGLDVSAELASIARLNSGREVLVGDLRRLDLEPGSFDGIWAMASLLHLDRRELPGVLASLRSLLRPGGVLFASIKRGEGEVADDTGRWFTLYGEDDWANHLRDAGFDVLEVLGEPADPGARPGAVAPGWISSLARKG